MMSDFNFDFTLEKFTKCLPNNKKPEVWFELCKEILPKYDITTLHQVAGFLAQCQHESNDFTILKENLNYGAKGLRTTFGKYFPSLEIALAYERKPQKIASLVYANRMGNGPESSGEGWKYRGRGIVQITGKDNYYRCSMHCFGDDTLLVSPDKLLEEKYALMSACWFWNTNHINECCDELDIKAMTKRINGGFNGIESRTENWTRNIAILKG